MLAHPQPLHGRAALRVTDQVISANPLDGDDGAAAQGRNAGRQRRGVAAHAAVVPMEGKLRAAGRAGQRLGMIAPVQRILIFGAALPAHRKTRHRRVGPVVRQPVDDGVTRPALRAVGERIAEAPRDGIAHFRQAVGADEVIRRQRGMGHFPLSAVPD